MRKNAGKLIMTLLIAAFAAAAAHPEEEAASPGVHVSVLRPLPESLVMFQKDSLTDQTVVIHSAMTCGIPSEQVSWADTSGTVKRIGFSACGLGEPQEWFFPLD